MGSVLYSVTNGLGFPLSGIVCGRSEFEASLQALRTEYLDVYLLHYDVPDASTAEVAEQLHQIRSTGVLPRNPMKSSVRSPCG